MLLQELNIETVREYCLSKPFAVEELPFDDVTLVFKVGGKMFAILPLDKPQAQIILKCDPEKAIELRDKYIFIQPAFHMNKTHWNMVSVNGSVPRDLVKEMIDESYDLIFNKLSKKLQQELLR